MQNPYSARIKGVQMKKYKIIYADPPWRYARSKVQGAAEKHYPTMSIEELCALPVKEIADKDCILFLWATFPQLKEALQLIKAWGFTYKSVAFVWLKQNRKSPTWFYGLGFWTRGNAEICLLATKGHPKRQSNKVHQFIISPVEQHSKKPDITREKILALMGDLPRIELILSRLVDTFISKISLTMLPVPKPHNTACVLSWEEARRWQSRSSGYSSS